MDDQKERPEAPVAEEAAADQETLARSIQEDERQDLLDEKVADTLRSCDREKKLSGGAVPEEAVREEIVQQTIDAEEMQETLDTRVLRDFDEGIVTMDRRGIIRYINPAASMILGLTDNAVGKLYRGVIHENLRRIFVGKHSEAMAIVVSSLIFGALHIHRGFIYMIAATALLSIFGVLYRRQNSIWGLCIPHFVLGEIIWFLGYV